MQKEEIIESIKQQYNRDTRKQLVKAILDAEKSEDTQTQYKLMNQIFSYVISQSGWNMSANAQEWDTTPLDIMTETFPKLKNTKWYKEQLLTTQKNIDLRHTSR
jgi:hypothetical protein